MNLNTKYMGINLKNPLIVGASKLTSNLETLKHIEQSGASAVILSSIFEEEIQLENLEFENDLHLYDDIDAEISTFHPNISFSGIKSHLKFLKQAKESLNIPVIASLNALNKTSWIEYSKKIAATGVDGIELNFYSTPSTFSKTSSEVEDEIIDIIKSVSSSIDIPVSIKINPYYTNPLNFISRASQAGAKGIVLFNKNFNDDIDVETETLQFPMFLSHKGDYKYSMKFAALLYGNISCDICSSDGVLSGSDIFKLLLVGSSCVQVVSALYKNNIDHIGVMISGLSKLMNQKGYSSIDDFKGKLSKKTNKDPYAFERNQYVNLLTNPNILDEDKINSPMRV